MSGTIKRLDLQFGSFACSVQGFDDPVQPVQQVLQALQNLLEETPDIADAGISFDADAIERLVGEVARRADIAEENVEIVPGLIIVHRLGDGAAAGNPETPGDEDEAWSRAFVTGVAEAGDSDAPEPEHTDAETREESREPEAVDDAGPGYINIFAPGARGDAGAESDTVSDAIDDGAPKDAPPRDIFADTGESADGSVFADSMAADSGTGPADESDPVNFFTAPEGADEIGDESDPGDSDNAFASVEPEDTREDTPEGPEKHDGDSERVETLFGRSEDQPEVEEADEGYTAAGLAQTADAETVAEKMVSAAAWMVLIQGQTTFTRREVTKVFETIPGEHSNTLEARIKGFGKAVRNGQLIMIEDGVFGLSRTELERFQLLL